MGNPFAPRTHLSVTFALLLAAIFGVALTALVLVQRTQRRSLAALLESETRERSAMMVRVVDLTGQKLRDFTYDYAQWDDMVKFIAAPRREWAAINLDAALKNFSLAAIWVLQNDGTVVYATRSENPQEPPSLPLTAMELREVLAAGKATSFFVSSPEGLLELCFSPARPSSDTARVGPPQGWLAAGRLWDEPQLRLIGDVLQCEVALEAPLGAPPVSQPNEISLHHALPGLSGAPAANLRYTIRSAELEIVSRAQRLQLALFAATFILTALFGSIFVFRWIVCPLKVVGESLPTRTSAAILPLLQRRDEIGRVAQAVKYSFEQHAALETMIEERTRLGRELHDGAIQTVFAAGMNLAGARALLRSDPAAAERILDHTRAELNATIRSLRDFIDGLEPEPLQQVTFREAVQSVVTLMQGVRPVVCSVHVDDPLAAAMTSRQRLNLLQITREAVSNSVRHGEAQHLSIRLARGPAGVLLEIADDGRGLEETAGAERCRGLANLAARARELGGNLEVNSTPRGGLRLRLTMPA